MSLLDVNKEKRTSDLAASCSCAMPIVKSGECEIVHTDFLFGLILANASESNYTKFSELLLIDLQHLDSVLLSEVCS